MSSCALRGGAALGHIERVHAVVSMLSGGINWQPSHVVKGRVEWQSGAHPEIHVRTEIIPRCPEVVFVIAYKHNT